MTSILFLNENHSMLPFILTKRGAWQSFTFRRTFFLLAQGLKVCVLADRLLRLTQTKIMLNAFRPANGGVEIVSPFHGSALQCHSMKNKHTMFQGTSPPRPTPASAASDKKRRYDFR